MPSVRTACRERRALFNAGTGTQKASNSPSNTPRTPAGTYEHSDWQDYHTDCAMNAFHVVPLSYAQHCVGALLVMTSEPANLDTYACKLHVELAGILAQALYTARAEEQINVDQRILSDILPDKVSVVHSSSSNNRIS